MIETLEQIETLTDEDAHWTDELVPRGEVAFCRTLDSSTFTAFIGPRNDLPGGPREMTAEELEQEYERAKRLRFVPPPSSRLVKGTEAMMEKAGRLPGA